MKTLMFMFAGLGLFYSLSDARSENVFFNALAPLGFIFFASLFLFWLVIKTRQYFQSRGPSKGRNVWVNNSAIDGNGDVEGFTSDSGCDGGGGE